MTQRTIRHPQASFELCLNAKLAQPAVDLWTTSMDQHWPDTNSPQQHQVSDDPCLQCSQQEKFAGLDLLH
jgi:hypothetical protein